MVAPLKLKRQQVKPKHSSNKEVAEENPVAKVLVHTPVSYLEDIYDYLVPAELSEDIAAGSIVKIEYGNSKTEGLVIERTASQKQKLKSIEGILGWPGMISPEVLNHLKKVQNRFGGSLWSLIDSYLPPIPKKIPDPSNLIPYASSKEVELKIVNAISKEDLKILESKSGLRYSIAQPAGFKPFEVLLDLIEIRSRLGQVLVIASDFREFDFLATELSTKYASKVILNDTRLGKVERFRNFQLISKQQPRIILGNRSSIFTPLNENSSIFVLNDNDPSHYEIRSPGWNSRDVSLLRGSDTSLFFFNSTPSYEIQRLLEINWLQNLKVNSPIKMNFVVSDGRDSFIPVINKALSKGNVLVSVAAKGYANVFLCNKCRSVANCKCGGKLRIKSANSNPSCSIISKLSFLNNPR